MNRIRLYLSICSLSLAWHVSTALSEEVIVNRKVELSALAAFPVQVDVGNFRPKTTVHLNLQLENPTHEIIAFDEIETSCDCLSVGPMPGKIEQDETHTIKLDLSLYSRPSSHKGQTAFNLLYKGRTTASVRLAYGYQDVVLIKARSLFTSIQKPAKPKARVTIPLPLNSHSPVRLSDVTCRLTPPDRRLLTSINTRKNTLDLSLVYAELKSKPIEGIIELRHNRSG